MKTNTRSILWRIHCSSPAQKLFRLINTDEGRSRFWAESAEEHNGFINFVFPNLEIYRGRILERTQDKKLSLIYFNAPVTFHLSPCENGGTDLTLIHENVPEEQYVETKAGWVSVLLALKAFADFGVDIRNHRKEKSWKNNFVDN